MIDKLAINEIAQFELSNSATDNLHFDKRTTRIMKSGIKYISVVLGVLISC